MQSVAPRSGSSALVHRQEGVPRATRGSRPSMGRQEPRHPQVCVPTNADFRLLAEGPWMVAHLTVLRTFTARHTSSVSTRTLQWRSGIIVSAASCQRSESHLSHCMTLFPGGYSLGGPGLPGTPNRGAKPSVLSPFWPLNGGFEHTLRRRGPRPVQIVVGRRVGTRGRPLDRGLCRTLAGGDPGGPGVGVVRVVHIGTPG
jgi:hypothetical protein